MISVIIPTLWQCPRLEITLQELSECPFVGEVLLFDNTERTKALEISKVRHILEGKNTYVGAPWNKGAKMASYSKLLVLNDDTWFDWNHLPIISQQINSGRGMLGISRRNYEQKVSGDLEFSVIQRRPNAFACAFFIHKESWIPIPEDIRIWYTDQWLFVKNQQKRRSNYLIQGLAVEGFVSKTVGYLKQNRTQEFTDVIKKDLETAKKYKLI